MLTWPAWFAAHAVQLLLAALILLLVVVVLRLAWLLYASPAAGQLATAPAADLKAAAAAAAAGTPGKAASGKKRHKSSGNKAGKAQQQTSQTNEQSNGDDEEQQMLQQLVNARGKPSGEPQPSREKPQQVAGAANGQDKGQQQQQEEEDRHALRLQSQDSLSDPSRRSRDSDGAGLSSDTAARSYVDETGAVVIGRLRAGPGVLGYGSAGVCSGRKPGWMVWVIWVNARFIYWW
jgi:hypothetical protein